MGPQAGFVVGSMSAFVSNFIFGQGPWTVFQMVAWGLIGMVAGALFFGRRFDKKSEMAALLIYGAASCFVFHGAITDLWTAFSLTDRPNLAAILTVYGTGLIADAVLALATVIFLLLMARPMLKKLDRVIQKYGLME
jgi:energy-coupling factor transport system substrate-specific component